MSFFREVIWGLNPIPGKIGVLLLKRNSRANVGEAAGDSAPSPPDRNRQLSLGIA